MLPFRSDSAAVFTGWSISTSALDSLWHGLVLWWLFSLTLVVATLVWRKLFPWDLRSAFNDTRFNVGSRILLQIHLLLLLLFHNVVLHDGLTVPLVDVNAVLLYKLHWVLCTYLFWLMMVLWLVLCMLHSRSIIRKKVHGPQITHMHTFILTLGWPLTIGALICYGWLISPCCV